MTYSDAIEAIDGWLQSRGQSGATQVVIRRAIQAAYTDWPSYSDWNCLRRNGRILLQKPYATGTISYDNATRTVALTGGVFPSWSADASILIGDLVCDIETLDSDTTLTLDAQLNPGSDFADGTSYQVYKRWYALPNDFASFWGPFDQDALSFGSYLPPSDYMAIHSNRSGGYGQGYYTIMPIQDAYGSVGLYWDNVVSDTTAVDFVYKRQPRSLRYTGHDSSDYAGTVAVTSGSPYVVGTNTTVERGHIGSIFRVSNSATNRPTGIDGLNPYREQRVISAVTDYGNFTLDANIQTSRSGVRYEISDPLDIEIGSYQAFLSLCKRNMAFEKDMKNKGEIDSAFRDALFRAKCSDKKSYGPRAKLPGSVGYYRLAYSTGSRDVTNDWS